MSDETTIVTKNEEILRVVERCVHQTVELAATIEQLSRIIERLNSRIEVLEQQLEERTA